MLEEKINLELHYPYHLKILKKKMKVSSLDEDELKKSIEIIVNAKKLII